MKPLEVLIAYNEPTLSAEHPDRASEAGVLESVDAVAAALAAHGHRARAWCIGPTPADFVESLARIERADVVFNLFEGFSGTGRGEAEIAGLVELAGYPLTGSPPECLGLARDKARTKWLLAGAGVPTAAFALVAADGPIDPAALDRLLARGAVIVKPAHEDASLGIGPESVVTERAAAVRQIDRVRGRYGAVVVEQFVVGREFNAAIVALPVPRNLPLAEIEFCGATPAGWQIVTYNAKWVSGGPDDQATPVACPARVEPSLANRIGQIALAAFRLAGCRDFARIDLRVDAAGQPYVLEVNANPDVGPTGGFDRALHAGGIAYDDFVDRLVRAAFARGRLGAKRACQPSTRR